MSGVCLNCGDVLTCLECTTRGGGERFDGWTHDAPTEPGAYWRVYEGGAPRIVVLKVSEHDDGELSICGRGGDLPLERIRGSSYWYRIAEPPTLMTGVE